jgi:hypothetical protein
MEGDRPIGRVRFAFDPALVAQAGTPIHRNLSAITREGDTVFLACDEGASLERLLRVDGGFARHRRVPLGELVDLPGGKDGEMDIEGLSIEGRWLWVAGSQSIKRRKVKERRGDAEALKALGDEDWEPNRQFLGRFPLVERDGGLWPVAEEAGRRAAWLRLGGKGRLRRWLSRDRSLRPFLDLPAKENGLDLEGIATRGDRLWIGLRGPVLGQSAIVLELELRISRKGHLKARRIEGRARFRRHFVDTDGQGIRDMKWDGADLLLVTGPVMSGNGPAAVLRLRGFADRRTEGYVGEDEQSLVQRLLYGESVDHPEGLVRWGRDGWLVIHDSPGPDRIGDDPPWVEADLWRLQGAA